MDCLKYSDKNTSVVIDRNGFNHNGRSVRWDEIRKCEEVPISLTDQGSKRYLTIELSSNKLKIDNWPDEAYMALRIVMKEMLQDKVKLDGPRYLKFGPAECEFTISIARFLKEIGLLEESKFAYNKAIELIEYYHNLKHELLVEPLTALSSMETDPDRANQLMERARTIGSAPRSDKSLFEGVSSARTKREKLVQALDEFRKKHKREPRPIEKARILKEVESE